MKPDTPVSLTRSAGRWAMRAVAVPWRRPRTAAARATGRVAAGEAWGGAAGGAVTVKGSRADEISAVARSPWLREGVAPAAVHTHASSVRTRVEVTSSAAVGAPREGRAGGLTGRPGARPGDAVASGKAGVGGAAGAPARP